MTEQPRKETFYQSNRVMPVNSGDPESYKETPTSVTIIYQKKEKPKTN